MRTLSLGFLPGLVLFSAVPTGAQTPPIAWQAEKKIVQSFQDFPQGRWRGLDSFFP